MKANLGSMFNLNATSRAMGHSIQKCFHAELMFIPRYFIPVTSTQ